MLNSGRRTGGVNAAAPPCGGEAIAESVDEHRPTLRARLTGSVSVNSNLGVSP